MVFRKQPYTDHDLIAMLRGAEPERDEALRYLYVDSGWRRIALRVIRLRGGTPEEAEDAVQEAVIVLDRHVRGEQFRHTASLKNYFIGICKGRWYSNRRSRRRLEYTEQPLPEDAADEREPETLALESEQKEILRRILNMLDERCRELLRLYKRSYSMDEIALELELGSANNARQRVHQCRRKLANLMKSSPFFNDESIPEHD